MSGPLASTGARAVAVIVVAAGSGTRLGLETPKAFVRLGAAGLTILERSLYAVRGMTGPVRLVVVAPETLVAAAREIAARAVVGAVVVAGGASRQASVAAGLAHVGDADVVLVHDAARALTPSAVFDRVSAAVRATGHGVVPGTPVADTIKQTDAGGRVVSTIDRSELSAVQTPQGFPADLLVEAYASAEREVTDDAQLFADLGHPVDIVDGDPLAFKITTPFDLERAAEIVNAESADRAVAQGGEPGSRERASHAPRPERSAAGTWPAIRVGIGTDAHAYSSDPATPLWLAGVEWPGERGLDGHSDGDVAAHAIVDALLSAAGLGDIGSVFGTSDPALAGAHGEVFLAEARRLVEASGFSISNVSVQLLGNRPRFSPRKAEAETALSRVIGSPVSVSATTSDGLGFTGRGEGLAAVATALIVKIDG